MNGGRTHPAPYGRWQRQQPSGRQSAPWSHWWRTLPQLVATKQDRSSQHTAQPPLQWLQAVYETCTNKGSLFCDRFQLQTLPRAKSDMWGEFSSAFALPKAHKKSLRGFKPTVFILDLGSHHCYTVLPCSPTTGGQQQGCIQFSCDKLRGGGRNCFPFLSLTCLHSPRSESFQSGSCH